MAFVHGPHLLSGAGVAVPGFAAAAAPAAGPGGVGGGGGGGGLPRRGAYMRDGFLHRD